MTTRRNEILWWLWHSEKMGAQVALLVSAFFWCAFLLLPADALELPNYDFMRQFGNDYGWALAWGMSVLLQMAALKTRGRTVFLAAGMWACTLHGLTAWNFIDFRLEHNRQFPVGIASEVALCFVAFFLYVFAPPKQVVQSEANAGLSQGTG